MISVLDRWRDRNDEGGSTLLELMVGMLIMMIFLGMFSGAIVLLYQTSNRANALTASSRQTDQAFSHLDKTVRYAYAISNPGLNAGGTAWYVEYLTTAAGTSLCTQLRVDSVSQQLQARTWTLVGSTAGTPTAWVPWASGITNGNVPAGSTSPPVPFVLIPPGSTNATDEQLTVQLWATSGSPAVPARTNATFTALNSAAAAQAAGAGGAANTVCSQVRP